MSTPLVDRSMARLLGAALFAPWRAWPHIWSERRDASWVYLLVGIESLFMRPELAVRAVWSLFARGPDALMPLLRLGSVQIVWALLLAGALALFLRLTRKGFAFGDLMAMTPWAYAPKLLVTLPFALGWAVGVVPASAMVIDGFAATPVWTATYHCLSLVAVGVSVACALRAYDSGDALPTLPQRSALAAVTGVALAIVALSAWRAQMNAQQFRPVGRGDRVAEVRFDALTAPAVTLTFPRAKPVVIDFWASWCGPCVAALPEWAELKSDAVDLVSANVERDNVSYVKTFLHEYQFPVVLAPDTVQAQLQVELLPTVIAISRTGEVTTYAQGVSSLRAIVDAATRE